MISRRNLLKSGGLFAAFLTLGQSQSAKASAISKTHIIKMESDEDGARVWFDPVGLYIEPGDKIRFVVHHNTHTVASYHPDNEGRSLRIPQKAKSWNSGYLVEPGDHFEITLSVPGVYDYYCEPHEFAGMAGRIIVGKISGPGARRYDYFKDLKGKPNWQSVPDPVRCILPDPTIILNEKTVRYDLEKMIAKCAI